MKKKIIVAAIVVAILTAVLVYGNISATVVEIAKVNVGTIEHTVVDTGYVQSADKYDIYAEQSGTVTELPVEIGGAVSEHQVVAVLENRDLSMNSQQFQVYLSQAQSAASSYEAALARTNLDLSDAEAEFSRNQELFSAGAISQVELDASRSALEKYQQSADELTRNLEEASEQVSSYQKLLSSSRSKENKLIIRSPIDGIMMQLPVELGQVVNPGTLLSRVAVQGNLEIKADILSDDLGEVKTGQKVRITAPVLGDQVLSGEIVEIYPQAEEKTSALGVIQRRVPTIIKLDSSGNLKPGYETRINIVTAVRENVLLIPREAVFTASGGEKQVMKVVDSRVVYAAVKTGLMDTKNIEIIEGLNSGDLIIKDASSILEEKTRVKGS